MKFIKTINFCQHCWQFLINAKNVFKDIYLFEFIEISERLSEIRFTETFIKAFKKVNKNDNYLKLISM